MNIDNTIEFYITSDINIAATLLVLGFKMVSLDPSNPSRVKFFFDPMEITENTPLNVEEVSREYWNSGISVNPRELFNVKRDLISRIREGERLLKD